MTKQPPPPPPPSGQGIATKLVAPVLLASIIRDLHELVFEILMPKTGTAKTVKIPIDKFHQLCNLASSACSSTQALQLDLNEESRLDNISRELEDIKARLATPVMLPSPSPQKHTYAAA